MDEVVVIIVKGCCEASKSSLMSIGQKTSPFGVSGPPVCTPSSSWLALVTESSVVLVAVDVVIIALVAKVDVRTKVVGEPLEPKWSRKVK
jgi:hypothetical protein